VSYRRKHIKSKISRIRPKRSVFTRLWFWVISLLLIAILSAAYFVLFYSGFQLKNIIISGNNRVNADDLQEIVYSNSNTGLINFWNIKITSSSIFLINEYKINKIITEKFPEIEKLAINKNLPQTLMLGVTERKPIGVFCDSANKCFLIDGNGIIFGPQVILPVEGTIVRQNLNSILGDGEIFAGEKVIAKEIVNAIYKIQKNLKDNFQINLKEALIASPVRLNVRTSEDWKIYFDLGVDSNINSQLTKLGLLLDGGISEDQIRNLWYIDLRPKDRAIICDNNTCGGL